LSEAIKTGGDKAIEKWIDDTMPSPIDPYNDIKNNLEDWVEEAIRNNG
jgi:hypothetical protein